MKKLGIFVWAVSTATFMVGMEEAEPKKRVQLKSEKEISQVFKVAGCHSPELERFAERFGGKQVDKDGLYFGLTTLITGHSARHVCLATLVAEHDAKHKTSVSSEDIRCHILPSCIAVQRDR